MAVTLKTSEAEFTDTESGYVVTLREDGDPDCWRLATEYGGIEICLTTDLIAALAEFVAKAKTKPATPTKKGGK